MASGYVSLPEGYHIWTPGRDDALRTIHSSSEIAAMGASRPVTLLRLPGVPHGFSNGKGGWMAHDGSMVLIYMVLHGSHQYTPFMLAYIYIYHTWTLWMEDFHGGFYGFSQLKSGFSWGYGDMMGNVAIMMKGKSPKVRDLATIHEETVNIADFLVDRVCGYHWLSIIVPYIYIYNDMICIYTKY